MTALSPDVSTHLPFLRRYARAMLGNQKAGDLQVRILLESLLADPTGLDDRDPRVAIYRLLHRIWERLDTTLMTRADRLHEATDAAAAQFDADLPIAQRLAAMPALDRQVLLLTSMEGFSIGDAARIVDIDVDQAADALARARAELRRQRPTTVFIIEDELIIAMSIADIVRGCGHRVVGTAATREEAVRAVRTRKPGLVLADVQLLDGSSGIDAVNEILEALAVPVIFITAFPERLLTGDRPEPAFVITKPFDPELLEITMSQALLTRATTRPRNAARRAAAAR
ncbi:MAG: response regulator [Alphaproteobacteria bacterium]|nr:response regulator [Alphaproteobacteria bacterium]